MIARRIFLAFTFAVMVIVSIAIPAIVPNHFAGAAAYIEPNLNANAPALAAKPFYHSGPILAWGDDSARQISDAPTGEFNTIAKGGAFQGLAIRSDETLVLWGGYNDPFAVPPVPTAFAGDEFVSAALGRGHALAIRPNGDVVGWGSNSFGQLNAPANVRFEAVAAGNRHSIGLAKDGALYGWGANDLGQINVPTGRFTQIEARVLYNIAIRDDGTLFGWGAPPTGIFANWTSDGQGHFYVAGKKFEGIAAGNAHALAINVNKTVEAWGDNSFGQLNVPQGVQFKEVGAGFGYSVGISKNGTLLAWGDNSFGQLNVPPGRFETVAAVAFHTSAIAH